MEESTILSGLEAFYKNMFFCDLEMTFGLPWASIAVDIGKVKFLKYTFIRSPKYNFYSDRVKKWHLRNIPIEIINKMTIDHIDSRLQT